jgi:hypothetical protein
MFTWGNLSILFLTIIPIIKSTISKKSDLRLLASDVETIKCFDNNKEKFSSFLINCGVYFEKCDDECIEKLDEFNKCADICRNHVVDPNEKFDWKCYDYCLNKTNNQDFVNLAKCIYNPCRKDEDKDFNWIVRIVIILLVLVSLGFFFIIYRHSREQAHFRKDEVREDIENFQKYTL